MGKGIKVTAMDLDNKNIMILSKKFPKDAHKFIHGNVLKESLDFLNKAKHRVVGNLPYNISTQILLKWILNLNSNLWFESLVLMFQKEVADRIISKYNTSNYGRLSVISNWKLNIKKIIDVSPNCFKPKPKIESTVLLFTPKREYPDLNSSKSLEKVTRIFFNQRRKKIRKSFNQLFRDSNFTAKKLD